MKLSKRLVVGIFIVILLCWVSTTFAKGPKANPFIPDLPEEWTAVYPADFYPDFEYNGLQPACSNGPDAVDDEFFFFVKGGSVNNLVVYFQGGGACWDPLTCLLVKPFTQDCTMDDMPTGYGGMFDFQNPDNLFKDWSFVFIPYCTGDIHWGANDITYSTMMPVGDSFVPFSRTIQHRGFVNFQVVMEYITDTFRKPQKIFVTGSSAGAYGALIGFPWIKEAYPKSKVTCLGDAGMGVNPPEYTQYTRENWNAQLPPWIFDTSLGYPTYTQMWNEVAAYYPHSKIAEFTNAFDRTQIGFYGLMFTTLGITPPADVGQDWHVRMWQGLDLRAQSPNYRYYVAEGMEHTILARDSFYTEDTAEGILFIDWLDAMIRNQGGTNGRGAMPWVNLKCSDCRPVD
jgi:hypothetical protein